MSNSKILSYIAAALITVLGLIHTQASAQTILAVSSSSASPGEMITVNWNGIVFPAARDWIGLYPAGAGDGSYYTWVYVSCTRTPFSGVPVGSCPILVPNTLPNGVYELRLFANDGWSRLATSPPLTIGTITLPIVTIAVTKSTATEGNVADTGIFTVSRAQSSALALTVNYTVSGTATPGSPGQPGADYITLPGSVTIPAGQGSATITVTTIDDNLVEGNESVIVTLSPSASYTLGSPASGTVTIIDNDVAAGPSLTASPGSVVQGGAVTASWSGIGNPTAKDWIGLYAVGAGDGSYQNWVYVSCTRTPVSGQVVGSCGIGVPSTLANGNYELRMFSNDGLSRLAISNQFAVTLSTIKNLTITLPARSVVAAPNVATLSISRDECSAVFSIPYIQASGTLTVSASVPNGSIPSGGGVKFVLNENLPGQAIVYSTAAPYIATFAGLAKGEYRLDAYIVDSGQNVIPGAAYHDFVTNIGIGDIFVAIGDSITEGYVGIGYAVPPYKSWLEAPIQSVSDRNYPQCGIGSGYSRDHWQEESHHIDLAGELETYLGYPVFILNEGVAGITTYGYADRVGTAAWQNRVTTLQPNKWLVHIGNNDVGGSPAIQNNIQVLINRFKSSYGADGSDIVLAVPLNGITWQPYINDLISANGLTKGPDFNTFYINNINPPLLDGIHPNVAGHEQMARLWALSLMAPKNVRALQVGVGQVSVSWDDLKVVEPTIAGYKVYYGTNVSNLTSAVDLGYTTTAFITIPAAGTQSL